MIEDALRTILLSDSTVQGIVGSQGVYTQWASEKAPLPLILYSRIGTDSIENLSGPSGLEQATIQFECWAGSYADARDLSRAVQSALQGFRGNVGTDIIQGISFVDMRDVAVPPTQRIEDGEYGSEIEFLVSYEDI